MRFVVLLFGLLAICLTAAGGALFIFFDWFVNLLQQFNQKPELLTSLTGCSFTDTGVFMLIAALYGLIGVVVCLMRAGWQGALLLGVPVVLTAAMNHNTLAFTALQGFTGLLSFLVFPLPLNPPKKEESEDDEDEEEEE